MLQNFKSAQHQLSLIKSLLEGIQSQELEWLSMKMQQEIAIQQGGTFKEAENTGISIQKEGNHTINFLMKKNNIFY